MPIEPSSTLIFWSSTRCGIWAASSKACSAETRTASLVRTSSRRIFLQVSVIPVRARCLLLQIGDQLCLPSAPRDRIENKACHECERSQYHKTGREYRRRKPGNYPVLDISDEDG